MTTGNGEISHILVPLPDDCTRAELEAYIERERILHILDKTLYKLDIAVSLPLLLANDFELLTPLLTEKELSFIVECTQSWKLRTSTSRHRPRPSKEHRADKVFLQERDKFFGKSFFPAEKSEIGFYVTSTPTESRENSDICKVIHMLCSRPRTRLRNLIKSKSELISPGCVKFQTNLKNLRNLVDAQLKISPFALRREEEELRCAWRRNEKAKLYIDELKSKLDKRQKESHSLSVSEDERIRKQKLKLARQARRCKFDIRMIVDTSENQMLNKCKQYEPKLQKLAQDVKGSKLKISSLLQDHLQSEQSLRARNHRIEGQLVAWLEKYDQDIGEKQAEWDQINAEYEAEMKEMSILQDEFDIQEEQHEVLMAEKEAEYQKELEEKMFIFVCNRAARRIQKYWREYRERKLARKRKHKGKKGKGSGKTK